MSVSGLDVLNYRGIVWNIYIYKYLYISMYGSHHLWTCSLVEEGISLSALNKLNCCLCLFRNSHSIHPRHQVPCAACDSEVARWLCTARLLERKIIGELKKLTWEVATTASQEVISRGKQQFNLRWLCCSCQHYSTADFSLLLHR